MVDVLYSAMIGIFAGLIPVYLGLIPLPIFKSLSANRKGILTSFSVGILLFLFADVAVEAIELSKPNYLGPALFVLGFILGLGAPSAISYLRHYSNNLSNKGERLQTGLYTGYMVALSIGLHNFGEGLALGAAYAAGQFGLTFLLMIGFALHNGTEGMGIAAPIADARLTIKDPFMLGLLAGSPTIIGSLLGSIAYSEIIGALFFSVAAGALVYVVVELLKIPRPTSSTYLGLAIGVSAMYLTDLLLSI